MTDFTPPPMPDHQPPTPEPPAPKKSHTNLIVIGAAVAVIAAIVGTGIVVVQSRDDTGKPAAAKSTEPAANTVTATTEEPTPTPSDTGPQIFGLTDTVSYETGVEVSLSKFVRATSSDEAAPANKPYVRFTVKVKNGSSTTVDTASLSVSCSYGQDGQSSDSIFDEGLDGPPSTKLLAGRSISVPWGCVLPKGEQVLQVEVTPDGESETAILTGNVK